MIYSVIRSQIVQRKALSHRYRIIYYEMIEKIMKNTTNKITVQERTYSSSVIDSDITDAVLMIRNFVIIVFIFVLALYVYKRYEHIELEANKSKIKSISINKETKQVNRDVEQMKKNIQN